MYNPSKRTVLLIAVIIFLVTFGVAYFGRQVAEKQTYLNDLKSLSFNKYLDLPVGYSDVQHVGGWDAYVFTAPEFQCVTGGPYVILVHKGAQTDKTVLWLEVGNEC